MADDAGHGNCNCNAANNSSSQAAAAPALVTEVVKAKIPQESDANFNLRLRPGVSLDGPQKLAIGCRPRGNRPGGSWGTAGISPHVVATLVNANKTMVAWLAKDGANAKAFVMDPIGSMREAGVDLSRVEEKALARAYEGARATRVVGPGINVASLNAEAPTKGGSSGGRGIKPSATTNDFGCGPKRKG